MAELDERTLTAVRMRQEGHLLKEIGDALGVSKSGAHAMLLKAEKHKRLVGLGIALSERTRGGLRLALNASAWEDVTPARVAAQLTERGLLDLPNIGPLSVEEVKGWLAQSGFTLMP